MDINYYLSIYIKHGIILTPLHLKYIVLKSKFMSLAPNTPNLYQRNEFTNMLDSLYDEVRMEMYYAELAEGLDCYGQI